MKATLYLVVCAMFAAAAAQSSGSMCGITSHRLALVDNRLFFASGNYTFADNKIWHNTSYMYWVDLKNDFQVNGMLGTDILLQSELPSEDLSTAGQVSGGASGAFFYDHTNLYPYGGFVGANVNGINDSLWSYNTTSDSWSLAPIDSGSISFGDSTEAIQASDPASGRSWMTGGWEIDFENKNNGMIVLNTGNSNNLTLEFKNGQGLSTLKGTMVYTRMGQEGTLISFGGDDSTSYTTYKGGTIWNERNMASIWIFDIASSTWYNLTATGDIPDPRIELCAGVSAAPDDSSFQITIHGGWSQENSIALDDVYVLTIPGFRWIKVNATGDPDTAVDQYAGRHRHKCEVWNQSQLLVVGGEVIANGSALNDYCNTTYPPIKVLDTSSYVWNTNFQTNKTYEVPEVIYNVVGGNSSGGANVTAPQGGWNSTKLESIFNTTVARDTYVPPSGVSSTSSSTATSSRLPSSGSSSHAGAIAGGVLGGLAGVALVLGGVLFWLKWPKRAKSSSKAKEASEAPTENEMPPDRAHEELDSSFKVEAPADGPRQELSSDGLIHEKPAGPTGMIHEMPEKPARRTFEEMP